MPATYALSQHDQLDTIIDEIGCGRFHVIAIIGLGFRIFVRGSFFSIAVILEPYFRCSYNLSYFVASSYVTSYLISFTLSAFVTGWIADAYGKRKTILLLTCMTLAIQILHVMSSSFLMVAVTMASCGLFQNAQYMVYPYLLEFLGKSERKYISVIETFYAFGWILSILVADYCIKSSSWQWAVVFCIILPLVPAIITVWNLPESPRYLVAKEDIDGAVKCLVRMSVLNRPDVDIKDLNGRYREILCDRILVVENDNDDGSSPSKQSKIVSDTDQSTEEEQGEALSLLNGSDLEISKQDLWKRIIVICIIRFCSAVVRSYLTYASGQRYKKDSYEGQCNECWSSVQVKQLISVSLGMSVALLTTYNLIARLKRRLVLRTLVTLLAIAITPFYFKLSDWLLSGVFFCASVMTECLFIVLCVYCSEVVPSSIRGIGVSLMFGASEMGSLFGGFFAMYFMHVGSFYTLLFIHSCIVISLIAVYCYVIETKDMSLN